MVKTELLQSMLALKYVNVVCIVFVKSRIKRNNMYEKYLFIWRNKHQVSFDHQFVSWCWQSKYEYFVFYLLFCVWNFEKYIRQIVICLILKIRLHDFIFHKLFNVLYRKSVSNDFEKKVNLLKNSFLIWIIKEMLSFLLK